MWHVWFVVCIEEIGRDGLTTYQCVEKKFDIVTNALRNGVLRALLDFIEKKCWIFHYSLSNFQGEKFEKVKLDGVGVCCWIATFMISWFLSLDHEWCDPLRSKVLYCIVKINKIECLVIHDVVDFLLILDNYVVNILKRLYFIKDYITRTPLPCWQMDVKCRMGKLKFHPIIVFNRITKTWALCCYIILVMIN